MKRRPLVAAAVVAGAVVIERLLAAAAPDGALHGVAVFFLVVCCAGAAFLALRWLWRKATYRVGARLFWSYLLIGLVPFVLAALLSTAALYMLVGQYAAVRFGDTMERCDEALARIGDDAAQALAGRGPAAAVERLEAVRLAPPAPLPRFEWSLADGGRARASAEGVPPPPAWTADGPWAGALAADGRVWQAYVRRSGARVVACLLPLDLATARRFSDTHWFEVRLAAGKVTRDGNGGDVAISLSDENAAPGDSAGARPGAGITIGGEQPAEREVEPAWRGRSEPDGGWLGKAWVVWFRLGPRLTAWSDGREAAERRSVALVRASPLAAWRDFTSSQYEAGRGFLVALKVMLSLCAALYATAVGIAAVQILTITRSTARLTRGAREVARGNLDHRIPVKRRDQLGDLAVSFNRMTDSVRAMLAEVAAKEHLQRELELAREIQEGLLPPPAMRHGDLAVSAHYRPAAEVGGDYFDVFSVAPRRLILAIGDVAGHGVSTGLLMAMVKSAVATLVREGRTGVDLLQRVNALLLDNPRRHRTASILLAEIDTGGEHGSVRLASAGHPPAFVVAADGSVSEAMQSALPLGHPWPDPPGDLTLPFAPGSRLVVYSDGLVEAAGADGAPLGYDGLAAALRRHAALGASELLAALLAEFDRHLGERPLVDDLTVVIVERAAKAAGDGV